MQPNNNPQPGPPKPDPSSQPVVPNNPPTRPNLQPTDPALTQVTSSPPTPNESSGADSVTQPHFVHPHTFNPTVIAPNGQQPAQPTADSPASQKTPTPAQQNIANPAIQAPINPSVNNAVPAPVPQNQTQNSPTNQASMFQHMPKTHQQPSPTTVGGADDIDLFGQKAKKRKMILALALSIFFVFGGISAYVFGFYIPNKPENVWKTGISRTGDEFKLFIDKISDSETYDSLAKNKVSISGEFSTNNDEKVSINFDSTFDETKTDSTFGLESDASGSVPALDLQAKVKTNLAEGSILPNIYFNIGGFTDLGVDNFYPGLSKYDGQWISVEQDFFEKYLGEYLQNSDEEALSNVTEQDILDATNDVSDVIVDYLFSNDPEKALLVNEEFVATEESEGITANHYKASLNINNIVKFCKASADVFFTSEAFKKINNIEDDDIEEDLKNAKESCDSDLENYDESEDKIIFDLWVDKSKKIIHKIRITEDLEKQGEVWREKKSDCLEQYSQYDFSTSESSEFCNFYDERIETGEKYVEIGQIYKGGDEISLFINSISDTNQTKDRLRGDMTINIDNLAFDGQIKYAIEDNNSDAGNITINVNTEPYDGEIDADKPEGSIPLDDVLTELTNNFNSSFSNGYQTQELGANTEEDIPPTILKPRDKSADWVFNLFGLPLE